MNDRERLKRARGLDLSPGIDLTSKFDYQPPRAVSLCNPNTGKETNTIHFKDGNTIHFKSEESK